MILETICVGPVLTNCYVLAAKKNGKAIIIDPGDEIGKIREVLEKNNLKPGLVINTHGHFDHIGCDNDFFVPVYVHQEDLALLKDSRLNFSSFFGPPFRVNTDKIRIVEDKDIIELEGITLEVLHIPGHSPGGIALLMKKPENKICFSGDTLFCQGVGRTDFPGASEGLLIKSIKNKLFTLSDDTVIYPGHGLTSTIGAEKNSNPFLI